MLRCWHDVVSIRTFACGITMVAWAEAICGSVNTGFDADYMRGRMEQGD
jgi:hypothetical protein